jgi:hypothetical protein
MSYDSNVPMGQQIPLEDGLDLSGFGKQALRKRGKERQSLSDKAEVILGAHEDLEGLVFFSQPCLEMLGLQQDSSVEQFLSLNRVGTPFFANLTEYKDRKDLKLYRVYVTHSKYEGAYIRSRVLYDALINDDATTVYTATKKEYQIPAIDINPKPVDEESFAPQDNASVGTRIQDQVEVRYS